jgi:hypothetical protein
VSPESDHQRVEEEWAAELAGHLHQTGWLVQRAGVTRLYGYRVASVYQVVTGRTITIAVSETDAKGPARRRDEILRQLSDANGPHHQTHREVSSDDRVRASSLQPV